MVAGNAFKSFTKTTAAYYTHPNRFLKGKICLECAIIVTRMFFTRSPQKVVVFYCDKGIKGFGDPEDNPLKEELTNDMRLSGT